MARSRFGSLEIGQSRSGMSNLQMIRKRSYLSSSVNFGFASCTLHMMFHTESFMLLGSGIGADIDVQP